MARVPAAIDLDNEPPFQANEIDYAPVPRRLSTEMKAVRSPCPEMNPQFYFLRRHVLAKIAGALVGHGDASYPTRPRAEEARVHPPRSGEGFPTCIGAAF